MGFSDRYANKPLPDISGVRFASKLLLDVEWNYRRRRFDDRHVRKIGPPVFFPRCCYERADKYARKFIDAPRWLLIIVRFSFFFFGKKNENTLSFQCIKKHWKPYLPDWTFFNTKTCTFNLIHNCDEKLIVPCSKIGRNYSKLSFSTLLM